MSANTIQPLNPSKEMGIHSNYLWFLTLTYSIVIILANWFDPRLIKLFGLTTDAGTLVFPLTFLLSDLITEVYGFKYARRAIWCGFLFNIIYMSYGQLIIHLPNPDFETQNAMFDSLLVINARIILASALSYLVSEPINAILLAKLKIKMQGRYMSVRFVSSTFIAAGIDSFVFGAIAFSGSMSQLNLFHLILSMWLIKVLIELCGLPISVYLSKKLKKIERIDTYDFKTNFSLFSLNTQYSVEDLNIQKTSL